MSCATRMSLMRILNNRPIICNSYLNNAIDFNSRILFGGYTNKFSGKIKIWSHYALDICDIFQKRSSLQLYVRKKGCNR